MYVKNTVETVREMTGPTQQVQQLVCSQCDCPAADWWHALSVLQWHSVEGLDNAADSHPEMKQQQINTDCKPELAEQASYRHYNIIWWKLLFWYQTCSKHSQNSTKS